MEELRRIELNDPVKKMFKLFPYILRRGLIPLAIGAAAYAAIYLCGIELLNRAMLYYMQLNLFNPVIFSLFGALVMFAVFNFGLQHGEYTVLGASRKNELIIAYIFGVIYSLVFSLFAVGVAYATQKVYSMHSKYFMLDLEYTVNAFARHAAISFTVDFAAFSLSRVAANINGKYAKQISIALLAVVFIGIVVFLGVFYDLCDKDKIQGGFIVVFGWKYMLPFGIVLLVIGFALDYVKTMFEYFR